mmetsp:Transcript_8156/g.23443  ORF Transcript_8156/g.23443 Transcript_8156/m.23443 type:complete len:257 (+) Transcript_8156:1305-2075(+)
MGWNATCVRLDVWNLYSSDKFHDRIVSVRAVTARRSKGALMEKLSRCGITAVVFAFVVGIIAVVVVVAAIVVAVAISALVVIVAAEAYAIDDLGGIGGGMPVGVLPLALAMPSASTESVAATHFSSSGPILRFPIVMGSLTSCSFFFVVVFFFLPAIIGSASACCVVLTSFSNHCRGLLVKTHSLWFSSSSIPPMLLFMLRDSWRVGRDVMTGRNVCDGLSFVEGRGSRHSSSSRMVSNGMERRLDMESRDSLKMA